MYLALAALHLSAPAHAFCGTYVGPTGSSLENGTSQVIVARHGNVTTLTLSADVVGDTSSFALVIPMPEVLDAADVSVVEHGVFTALDAYSAPRIVSYTCDDLHGRDDLDTGLDTGDTGAVAEDADGVVVENAFAVGGYDISVLSATGAEGLLSWLDANGYSLPATSADVLQSYIDAGQYFLAAKVSLDAEPTDEAFLPPLQFRYSAEMWSLPIRIGTTVSPGEQDVVIFALTSAADGAVGISNYPEAPVESDCMLPEGTDDMTAFYAGQLDNAFAAGIWFTEYAWDSSGCDPCSGQPPSDETLTMAGVDSPENGAVLTRLRLRYSPEEATQDLVLYASGLSARSQVKYVQYVHELEADFPVCGVGMVVDGGECPDGEDTGEDDEDSGTGEDSADGEDSGVDDSATDDVDAWDDDGEIPADDDAAASGCGCASGGSAGVAYAGLAGLALLARRRR